MKRVIICDPRHAQYPAICQFAHRVYESTIKIKLHHYPEVFFAIIDEAGQVIGCIGLNHEVSFDLFVNNRNFREARARESRAVRFAEQSVLALSSYPFGLPMLISAAAAYGEVNNIHRIVYAGINVSVKTINKLGFSVACCGSVDMTALKPRDRVNYQTWYNLHDPSIYVLDTNHATDICFVTSQRLRKHLRLETELQHRLKSMKLVAAE